MGQQKTFDPVAVGQWVDQLGHPDYIVRQNAKEKIRQSGETAFEFLHRARNSNDLQVRLASVQLLSEVEIDWIQANDSVGVKDLMFHFKRQPSSKRLACIDQLVWLPANEAWKPLNRIARYDLDPGVRNHAAVSLAELFVHRERVAGRGLQKFAQVMQKRFETKKNLLQADVFWSQKCLGLLAFFFLRQEVEGPDLPPFLGLMKADQSERSAGKGKGLKGNLTPLAIQCRLIRVLFPLCKEEHQKVLAAMIKDLNFKNDKSSLKMMLQLLVTHRRWTIVNDLHAKQSETIESDLLLGMMIAESLLENGKIDKALETADRVLEKVDVLEMDLPRMAMQLVEHNLTGWSVMVLAESFGELPLFNADGLLWAELTTRIKTSQRDSLQKTGRVKDSKWVRQWVMEYLNQPNLVSSERVRCYRIIADIALGWNDAKAEFDALNHAIGIDPIMVDVLVRLQAVSRLGKVDNRSDFEEAWNRRVANAEGALRDRLRRGRILMNSTVSAEKTLGRNRAANAANSLARLLSHVGESTDESLEMAREAVQLNDRSARFLETLSDCEHRAGNSEKALEIIKKAVYLSPFDDGLKRKLVDYD